MRTERVFAYCLFIALAAVAGCGRYPEVSSAEGLRYIGALRTACSTASKPRLDKVAAVIDRADRDGKLTAAEREAFRRILDRAAGGNWKEAETECLAFQKAQVRGGWLGR